MPPTEPFDLIHPGLFDMAPSPTAPIRAIDPRLELNDDGQPNLHVDNFRLLGDEASTTGTLLFDMTREQLRHWIATADRLGMGDVARTSARSLRHNFATRDLAWFDAELK